ncbi:MAG: hypothetical protein IT436_04985 [Phycisphaerales bacterium]|nr:hypothetical protein [Phycisphaerales bacterium]
MSLPHKHFRRRSRAVALAAGVAFATPVASSANDNPVILQWFEAKWTDMERRAPDFFIAGYGGVWIPPATKGSSTGSAGYDVWDRFDLGSASAPTAYGTEQSFRAVIGELHQANGLVFLDAILNHNSSRQTSVSFQQAGGYPGFWMASATPPVTKQPTHNWGDFHAGIASGYYQSEDPGGARYDLHRGDLVSLIDISQETNHQFIRHPTTIGNPDNIPSGTIYNRPDPANARFYPDRQLPGVPVTNPGTSRSPGVSSFTFYPYNTTDPLQGDPVKDNGTGLLMRWTQWMMDEHKIDGFRWDAIKHVPSWFWDTYIDAVIYQRRVTPDGRRVTPYSFGECVEGQSYTYNNYIRKDSFGNRDALDINGSGELRNIIGSGGFGSWQNVLNAHLDTADDGLNNGSIGVNHVQSHDNGSAGDGGSAPPDPTARQVGYYTHAYVLMRAGVAEIYHNGRGISRPGGFWPRQGVPNALGVNPVTSQVDSTISRVVQLHNSYARGEFNVLNSADLSDVLIFERRTNLGGGSYSSNVLVGVNDRFDTGYDERTVTTSFPAGTRLVEQSGNAADPALDPSGQISEVLTVNASRQVTIRIPRNKTGSTEHAKGFVIYGPAIPSGTLTLAGVTGTLPADPISTPSAGRRFNAIPVITGPAFDIDLTTASGDPAGLDPNTDDNAVFRIDQGYTDQNGNGIVDIGYADSTVAGGYEQFITTHQPLFGSGLTQGRYIQTIDASGLSEGLHYISVIAFRHRNVGEAPIFREFRQPVYIDRAGPAADLVDDDVVITATSKQFTIRALDRTATRMHLILDLAPGADPIAAATVFNQANRRDRFEWFRTLSGLTHGPHRATVVAFEETGNAAAHDFAIFVDLCPADLNKDGIVDFADYLEFLNLYDAGDPAVDFNHDGIVDFSDYLEFLNLYDAGC